MHVEELASRTPITIPGDATLALAAETMHAQAVGALLVVGDDGRLVGIVTDRDLCLRAVARDGAPAALRVRDVMTSPVFSIGPDEPLERALELVRAHGVRRLPVCRDGRPVAMFTTDDGLAHVAQALQELADETALQRQRALRDARAEVLRAELEARLTSLHDRLALAGMKTRDAFLGEIDAIKAALRRLVE